MAHGTRVHECGGEGGAVTITLPGPPVAARYTVTLAPSTEDR